MELLGFVLLVIVWLLVVAGIRSWKTRAKYPPGPMALPFIGHYHLLGTPPLHQSFSKLAERYGPLMFLRFGSAPVVVASSPEAVAAIFKSNDVTFANRQLSAATERLSYGRRAVPFIPYGPDWAFIKKLIATHLLGSDRSERIHTQELHRLIRFLLEMSQSGQTVNFTWELLKMSRNNMCQMLIGKGLYLDLSTGDELEGLIREVIKLATDSHYSVSNICTFLKHLDLDGILKRVEDLFQRFDGFLEKVVTEREEVRKNRRAGDIAEEDFLEVMLNLMEDVNSNNPITREQIKALLLDNMIGGTESTAVALDWTLAELLKHPEVMKKAQQEVDEVVGKTRLVNLSDSKHLTYVQAIIKESFRLHPPIPLLALTSSKECKISGFTVPANSTLFVNVLAIGRDPKVWDDEPLEFRPDRFLNGSAAEKFDVRGRDYQLLPFGTGKRSCPAFSSSLHELTITVAAIVQCFDLKVEKLDMSEKVVNAGPGAPRRQPLQCFPKVRFNPPNIAAT